MNILIWTGFFLAMALLLVIARKNLWLALIIAAYTTGIFSLSLTRLWQLTIETLTEPSTILLAISVGIIPIIGGAMEYGGLLDDIVNNLKMKRRSFMAFTSALIGLLPLPGGALLSAPLIERGGAKIPPRSKTAVNVWYRHVFLLIYPLGALLVTSSMAKINLYTAILYLIPGFLLMVILGYLFVLRKIEDNRPISEHQNNRKLAVPILVILSAPVIHLSLMTVFPDIIQEIHLLTGVLISLILAFVLGHIRRKDVQPILVKMKPWNFALIILGMFLFLNIFQASKTSQVIADASFSKLFIVIVVGFFLGFATGRVQVPISILLPIYLVQFGAEEMTPMVFALMFFVVYQGYVISPVHPCVCVSLEYFRSGLKDYFKSLAFPTAISVGMAWITGLFTLQ